MQAKTFEVTHFYRSSPSSEGWIQTDFITNDANDREGEYHLGFEGPPIPKSKIEADLKNGSLIRLPFPKVIGEEESLWISEDQNIIIADAYDPSEGRQMTIYRDNVSDPYDTITVLIERVIKDGANEKNRERLENCITAGNWKILLGQVLKYISWGEITKESNFEYFGYLFVHVQKLFEEEFTEFENREKFAIAYGSLCFETSVKKFDRWEISLLEDTDPEAVFGDEYNVEDSKVNDLLKNKSDQNRKRFEMQG